MNRGGDMNELRDLVIAVDGYSVDRTGFEITEAHKGNGFWSLTAKAYRKEGEDSSFSEESNVNVLTLADRIESKYGTRNLKWALVKVEELASGSFDLVVKKVTDEKEDSSDKEEHMEAEE